MKQDLVQNIAIETYNFYYFLDTFLKFFKLRNDF